MGTVKKEASSAGRRFFWNQLKPQMNALLDAFVANDPDAAKALAHAQRCDRVLLVGVNPDTFSTQVEVDGANTPVQCPKVRRGPYWNLFLRYYFRGQVYSQGSDGLCSSCVNQLACAVSGTPKGDFETVNPQPAPKLKKNVEKPYV